MDWTSIAIHALAGGLAVGLAELVFRKRKRGTGYTILVVILLAVASLVASRFILPEIRAAGASSSLDNIEAYRVVKILEPKVRQQMDAIAVSIARNGDAAGEGQDRLRFLVQKVAMKYAARSPDEPVTKFAQVVVARMEQLQTEDPRLCYQYLFPRPGQRVRVPGQAGSEPAELVAMAEMLKGAANNPQKAPQESDMEPILEKIGASLVETHGEDGVGLLADAKNRPDQAKEVCAVSIDLYKTILALPKDQQGPILRFVLGQGAS